MCATGRCHRSTGCWAGVEPVVLAIVAQALWALGRKTITGAFPALIGLASMGLYLLGVPPLWILLGAGLVGLLARNYRRLLRLPALIFTLPLTGLRLLQSASQPFSYWTLFLTFLKIGAVLYGSGYVLLAFLQADFVERLGWISQQQLLDAVAIGQITPGPVFTAATFIGYILGGVPGALLATLGIFLPSFVFVALSNPLIPRIRNSPWAAGLLDGVNYASLGLMAGVLVELSRSNSEQPVWPGAGAALAVPADPPASQHHLADPGGRACRVAVVRPALASAALINRLQTVDRLLNSFFQPVNSTGIYSSLTDKIQHNLNFLWRRKSMNRKLFQHPVRPVAGCHGIERLRSAHAHPGARPDGGACPARPKPLHQPKLRRPKLRPKLPPPPKLRR